MTQTSIKKNTVYNAAKTIATIMFPVITFPYISRVLLSENVGKIIFGQSIVSYFSLIASLGISTYAIRECSAVRGNSQDLSNLASQIYSINIITTIISYIFLSITLLSFHKLFEYRVLICIQSISILFTTIGADWLNSAMEDFKFVTVRTIAFQMISFVLMLTFVHEPDDYIKYAVINLLSSAGANITNMRYRKRYCDVRFTINIEWRRHIMPIIYLFVMMLAQTIFNSVDSTMLGLICGDREVGIYGTAYKMQNLITQVIVSVAIVAMPRMSHYFAENDYESVNRLYRKIFGFFCILGLPSIVGTVLLSKEIIEITVGIEYSKSARILALLMVGYIPCLFGGSLLGNIILLPSKREKTFMITCCIAALINVLTNYFLIPRLSSVGAALTTGFCNLIILIILVVYKDCRIKLKNVRKLVATPIIGCLGICLVCFGFNKIQSLWVRTAITIFSSVVIYVFIQYLGKNELFMEIINSSVTRINMFRNSLK